MYNRLTCFLVIKDWSVSNPLSHLEGGMRYNDGRLVVPTTGRYFVYAQLYVHNGARAYVEVDGTRISMIQPLAPQAQGISNAIGVFKLNAGQSIYLIAAHSGWGPFKTYMASYHSYFGAFLI